MHLQKIPFRSTRAFTEFFLKYMEQDASLSDFYSHFPTIENFEKQISEKSKSFPDVNRKILVERLQQQYLKIPKPPKEVHENIQSLQQKNTFTVTTGHQLNIFTGPLYFIYKIVTVINVCKKLKERYPDQHFVPVYWMATEDHDYEEIKYFRLYGKKYVWETSQHGAVGRFNTKELKSILKQLPGDVSIFEEAYSKNDLLSDAVRHYVNTLFGAEGLVVIDADDRELKKLFEPVVREDLFNHGPYTHVSEANSKLEKQGFHPQVNPREINFFYLDKNLRSRIEKKDEDYLVLDTPMKFSKQELEKKIKEEPEKFSPNVILRPLYQEMILPNLAYAGGPAELVYWLELKTMFNHFQIPFPILLPRNFAMVVDSPISRKVGKTGLDIRDFFDEKNYLFNHWVTRNSSHDLSLGGAMKVQAQLLSEIEERCEKIDPTLSTMIRAESKKIQNALEKVEKKMLRAEKRLHADRLRQIEEVKDALFPNGSLQERSDNFLNFYQSDPGFIKMLLRHFDPFDFQFNVLTHS